MDDSGNKNRLSKEQKIGVILLSCFVVLAVALGFLRFRDNMYRPFALDSSIPPFLREQVDTPDALRYRDTDVDGLNDFDELYVYNTSPYLADTDSDGFSDKDELDKGRNPLCDEAKNCNSTNLAMNPGAAPTTTAQDALYGQSSPATLEEYLSDPSRLREILIASGLDKNLVAKFSDDDLLKMATEIFASSTMMNQPAEDVSVTATAKFINEAMGTKK